MPGATSCANSSDACGILLLLLLPIADDNPLSEDIPVIVVPRSAVAAWMQKWHTLEGDK